MKLLLVLLLVACLTSFSFAQRAEKLEPHVRVYHHVNRIHHTSNVQHVHVDVDMDMRGLRALNYASHAGRRYSHYNRHAYLAMKNIARSMRGQTWNFRNHVRPVARIRRIE